MGNRLVGMGVDIGGTHTKAVAIDNTTYKTIGKSSVKTTHGDRYGVATGVIKAFQSCSRENDIAPKNVTFVTHSTTQATNTLIEGDVAYVGALSMRPGGMENFLTEHQTRLKNIDLGSGKSIQIKNRYLSDNEEDKNMVRKTVKEFKVEGVQVLVASDAYGVDDVAGKQLVFEIAHDEMGMETTVASDITRLYGLTRRTRTVVIDANILARMLNTANSTKESIRGIGVEVPLIITRGDDGAMGSLMYLRASNGVCFEAGGITINVGVVKNGRPTISYSVVDGYRTYISSLDVRVLDVAGRGMIQVNKNDAHDVGSRSAHIAGLDYAGFTDENEIVEPRPEFFSPKEGVPEDYVVVRLRSDKRVVATSSCAANVLGLVIPKDLSYRNVNAARKAVQPIADHLRTMVGDVTVQIPIKAYERIEPIITEPDGKYRLEHDQISLVGVGGSATPLIGFCANKMNIKYNVPENVEVISPIDVALAMVRNVAERVVPNPTPEDIRSTK